jgi:hypothetical protein
MSALGPTLSHHTKHFVSHDAPPLPHFMLSTQKVSTEGSGKLVHSMAPATFSSPMAMCSRAYLPRGIRCKAFSTNRPKVVAVTTNHAWILVALATSLSTLLDPHITSALTTMQTPNVSCKPKPVSPGPLTQGSNHKTNLEP